ncbi:MAG TPA: hypothetical protein VGM88_23990 [Kofleriaceae bacterium]
MKAVLVLAGLVLLAARVDAAPPYVPTIVTFSARVVDDKSGKPLDGSHHLKFELFDAEEAGHSAWSEEQDAEPDIDGVVYLDLGASHALSADVFTGPQLFLEVTLDGTVMSPRVSIDSIPYAFRSQKAGDSDTVGGLGVDALQKRVTGMCSTGSFITGVAADGTVSCAAGATGTGDITAVIAGNGLTGGAQTGDATLSLIACAQDQILKWNGAAWACAADEQGAGTITGVVAGPGLQGGGTSGTVTLGMPTVCGFGQLLKWNGSTWACANDIDTDTNSGGDITSVNVAVGGGMQGGGPSGDVTLGLLTTCASGQLLKFNGSSWACANDIDTDTNSGGTITGVVAGNGLQGGGTSGSVTLNIGQGTGIIVSADTVSLDTTAISALYVQKAGDTMSGALNMNNNRVTNRGCLPGYIVVGPGLCTEALDGSGFTFTGCANRCRGAGTHMCTSSETRAMVAGAAPLSDNTLLDWMDDQDAAGSALYVSAQAATDITDAARVTSTSSYCRCCESTE